MIKNEREYKNAAKRIDDEKKRVQERNEGFFFKRIQHCTTRRGY